MQVTTFRYGLVYYKLVNIYFPHPKKRKETDPDLGKKSLDLAQRDRDRISFNLWGEANLAKFTEN